ncbi:DUF2079 domain-containing protein [Sulfobacillus thermosulfidooxidans]|uniref:DUF2079 domain-containing protein n=1 Tax=Sulfobacillus thermosulfidooxidans TaxID=28034 RepID=UPI001FA8CB73|nr:DUF2079 domain-containing protein [Sulfobacillus thermosulfidooxidans]
MSWRFQNPSWRGIARSRPILMANIVVLVAISVFCAFQIFVSVHKYLNGEAMTLDLGYAEQTLWEISHGNWWAFSSVVQSPVLSVDGSLWLYPLAYGFRFLGRAYFLFVVQAAGTAAAAWGLYRVAQLQGLSHWQSATVTITFLCYPAIIGGSQFDFHPDFVALPFVIWAYFYYRMNDKPRYYGFLLSAIFAKDVVLISVVGWGIGLIVWERRVKDGVMAILLGLGLLLIEMMWIFPTYFPGVNASVVINFYGYLGHSFSGIILGMVEHVPVIIRHLSHDGLYAFLIFAPVLVLPVFGKASVPAMLSLFLLNALSSFPAQHTIVNQYQVILSGWVFLSLIEALRRLGQRRNLFLFSMLTTTMLLQSVFLVRIILPEVVVQHDIPNQVTAALHRIPTNDVLYTQNHLGVWAYRYPIMGVANNMAPGQFVDALPVLWNEAHKSHSIPTAIIAQRPVSPYLADIIFESQSKGYHVTYHRGNFLVLQGTHRFPVPRPSPDTRGWEPVSHSWAIPLWTQSVALGHINWKTERVMILRGNAGNILPHLHLLFYPGQYHLTLEAFANHGFNHRIVGTFKVGIDQTTITSSTSTVIVTVHHIEVLPVMLDSTGRYVFQVSNIIVHYRAFHPMAH